MKDKQSTNSNTKTRTVRATKTAATNKDFRDFQPSTDIIVSTGLMQNRPSEITMENDFRYLPDVVARDTSLTAPAARLYMYLLSMSDIQTGETPPIYIAQLAEMFNRTKRTIQRNLAILIEKGYIERVFCKNKAIPKQNEASYFIITHVRDANSCAENKGQVR